MSSPSPNEHAPLRLKWLLNMAWRDSRTYRRRLLLYMSSIILGTAALVSIRTLGDSMRTAVNLESRALLGADLDINTRRAFSDSAEVFLRSLGGAQSRQTSFASMVAFPRSASSRLVQVRALEGDFPYYGELETSPPDAAQRFRTQGSALVDDNLMIQHGAEVGDSIRVGLRTFEIEGRLIAIPGETAAMSTIGPRVYIPLADLESTALIQPGSRATYRALFRFDDSVDVQALVDSHGTDTAARWGMDWDTVADRQAGLERSLGNLYRFLNLSGFIALILGSVGVASAIHTYVRRKRGTIAVLRCLGAEGRHTVTIYVIQAVSIGVIGSSIGAAAGFLVLGVLPALIQDFVPFELDIRYSFLPVLQGMGLGLLMALLFALLPLIAVRDISPLLTLRSSVETPSRGARDPWRLALIAVLVTGIVLFSVTQSRQWYQGVGFAAGLIVAFALLSFVARGLIATARRLLPARWPYVWRQGMANLFRPDNQTVTMVVALGLGAFLLTTLYLLQFSLVGHISQVGGERQSNMVLFDIQPDQRDDIVESLERNGLPVMQQTPVVSMRLAGLNGRTTAEIMQDSTGRSPRWALRREYRSTYRGHLEDAETLLDGTLQPRVDGEHDAVLVSVEKSIADRLGVGIGDEIVFDVQGVPVKTTVGSLRAVDWQRVQPNFFMVFPEGVLEEAPQFHVIVTRIDDPQVSARFQQETVSRFPNVSMIDLSLILGTLNDILGKVSLIVRFMALFSVFTGVIVLVGVVTNSRLQRMQESVLLKTLGGSRNQILKIMSIEYLFLGVIGAVTGVVLAYAATWILATFVFNISFIPAFIPVVAVIGGISAITITVGMLASTGIYRQSPLEVLRSEI
ncbi:MAG: FtsX-like permease family protein [Gemmatimonadetes bacterium]|nr:FtsX-like permease family protein [Gemmatimonadota bacterium]